MLSLIILCALATATLIMANYSTALAQKEVKHYSFAFKWGSNGTEDGQFMRPHDIAFDSQGNVYVSDRDINNIQKFTHDGKFLLKWGQRGTEDGDFSNPYSITIDKDDYLYVVDKDNNRIQKFDSNGKFIQKWDRFNATSGGHVKLRLPEAMAFNPSSGDVYITDTGNNRTIKLNSKFNFMMQWGYYGKGQGQFDHPHGIGVDSSGNVYVNELNVARIQKFDSNGNFVKQCGSEGTGNGQFTLALEHLFVDAWDNIWQVDGEDNPRMLKFDSNGNFITNVGSGRCVIPDDVKNNPEQMAKYTACDGMLHMPEHANVDSSGNLYVVDRGNQRIVVYTPQK